MKVVDSSGWLEFLADGPLADEYERHLSQLDQVLTPSIVVLEVYKWVKRERSEEEALVTVAQMTKTEVIALTTTLAMTAADFGLEYGLAMADSIVYATALSHGATLVTSDRDFADLPGIEYLEKVS